MIFDHVVLLSDIDGTLATYDRKIVPANVTAIEYFIKNGGRFALATGRSATSMVQFMANLPVNCPCIVNNGGSLYDVDNKSFVFETHIDPSCTKLFDKVTSLVPGVGIEINAANILHCIRYSPRSESHVSFERGEFQVYELEQVPHRDKWNKCLFTGKPEEIDKALEILTGIVKEDDPYYILRSEPTLLEVLPPESAKGKALVKLANYLGEPIQNMYAIGDYYNDLDMLEAAGTSATVADAPKEVLAVADMITCSCKDGAVADFIKQIENDILNRRV